AGVPAPDGGEGPGHPPHAGPHVRLPAPARARAHEQDAAVGAARHGIRRRARRTRRERARGQEAERRRAPAPARPARRGRAQAEQAVSAAAVAAVTAVLGWIAERGPVLLLGTSIVLAGGLLAQVTSREPAARRRLGVLTALGCAVYLAMALVPLPRWSWPAPSPTAAPPDLAAPLRHASLEELLALALKHEPTGEPAGDSSA